MMERAEPPLFLFQLFMLFRRVKTVGICGFQGLTTKRFTVNYQEIYGQLPRDLRSIPKNNVMLLGRNRL